MTKATAVQIDRDEQPTSSGFVILVYCRRITSTETARLELSHTAYISVKECIPLRTVSGNNYTWCCSCVVFHSNSWENLWKQFGTQTFWLWPTGKPTVYDFYNNPFTPHNKTNKTMFLDLSAWNHITDSQSTLSIPDRACQSCEPLFRVRLTLSLWKKVLIHPRDLPCLTFHLDPRCK